MTSVLIYTIISCALFWVVYSYRSSKHTVEGYSLAELIPFYAIIRLVPLFMMQERSIGNYVALGIDALVLAAVCFTASGAAKSKSIAAAAYMFFPLPVICIAAGGAKPVMINIAVTAAALIFLGIKMNKYPLASPAVFTGGYAMAGTGFHLAGYGMLAKAQKFGDLLSKTSFPTFLAAGLMFIAAGIVLVFVRSKNYGKAMVSDKPAEEEKPSLPAPERFGKKNVIQMLLLTAVYAVIVFWQIGSHSSPETNKCFNAGYPDRSEIVLDLGQYMNVSRLELFLGPESLRKVSVSTYNEVDREWVVIKEAEELKTAFAWNHVDIGWDLRYIGIVFQAEDTHLNEIVVLDGDKNVVTPVNASDFSVLFDEQDLYPGEEATYYYRMMFDEIYHGRTGYEFLYDLPIYENTHPPLGKTLISLGILAFGMNPFGWRFTVAVFGVLLVPIMYLFGWKISRRSWTAFTAAVLIACDCMHLTLSRIATIDIIVADFILLMFLFMFCFIDEMNRGGKLSKQLLWIFLSGVSTALAIATKWTGIYAAGGVAVIFFTFLIKYCAKKKTFKESLPYLVKLCIACVISFVIIPLSVYALSYIEFAQVYKDKGIIKHAIDNSKFILSYHSGVTESHPYQSEWYEWITDKKPLLDAINTLENDRLSSVATFNNPVLSFLGLAAFFHNIFLWRTRKCTVSQFLAISYIAMLMPWLFVHRTVFIYQYFGCVLIIALLIANSLLNLRGNIKKKEIAVMAVTAVVFIMFIPEAAGLTVPRNYIKHVLELVPTWIFE